MIPMGSTIIDDELPVDVKLNLRISYRKLAPQIDVLLSKIGCICDCFFVSGLVIWTSFSYRLKGRSKIQMQMCVKFKWKLVFC